MKIRVFCSKFSQLWFIKIMILLNNSRCFTILERTVLYFYLQFYLIYYYLQFLLKVHSVEFNKDSQFFLNVLSYIFLILIPSDQFII